MEALFAPATGRLTHPLRLHLQPVALPDLRSRSKRLASALCRETSGAAAVEYLLLIGLLALAAILSLRGTTTALGTNFSTLGNTVQNSTHH